MSIEVRITDKVYYDSPQAGHPNCICSRCGQHIKEDNAETIRAWPTEPGDFGYDPLAPGGTEFRYCRSCCEGMGVVFFDSWHEEDPDDLPGAPAEERRCRVCGCTDHDCRQCIEKTGQPCYWVAEDLCSACARDKKQ